MAARWKERPPALVVVLAIVALVAAPSPSPSPPAGTADEAEPDPRACLERAVRLAQSLGEQVLTDDRCPYSPAGVVLRIGTDPEALAAFVRDRIAYEPYLGVVRGPEGTLAAGAGGDWDRAALLRALLAEAGHAARLVVEPRGAAEQDRLVRAFLSSAGRERTLGAADLATAVAPPPPDPLLARVGIALHNRAFEAARAAARWRGLLDEAHDAGAAMAPLIARALGENAVGQPAAAWLAALRAGAAERVSVEIDRPARRRLSAGPEPEAGAGGKVHESLPESRRATLRIALEMTVAGEGAPREPIRLIERTFGVDELFLKPVRLQIAPDGTGVRKPPETWSDRDWLEVVTGFERFQAILEIDRLFFASDAFDVHGRTFKVASDGRVEAAKEIGAAVGRGFGGLGGGGGARETEPATRIGALVLRLDLALPGEEPVRAQRLLHGELRRDVSPVYHTDFLVFGGPVSPECALWKACETATHSTRFLATVLGTPGAPRLRETPDLRFAPEMHHEWQLARLALADRLLAADESLALRSGPAVVMQTTFLVPDAAAGRVGRRTVLDVVHDAQLLVPRGDPTAVARAVAANMHLGAATTVFETLLVRDRRPEARLKGAYAEFERALAAGEPLLAARADDLASVTPTPLSRWAIGTHEGSRRLVFPGARDVSAWWSVDPATGATLGRGDGGEGQSLAEYKAAIDTAMKNLKCMLGVVGGIGSGKSSTATSYEWAKCITGFDPMKPSSYAGAYGKYQKTVHGLEMWSKIADGLSGVEKLIEKASKSK
ncbi:MAG: hypothetical protein JXQ29_16940 [Planctomycetes bacterium]|nr:hypothetical protein [Planctomycetota bacterium]